MAAPSIVPGYTVAARTSNGTTLAVTVPTHTDGDTLYFAWASDGDADSASINGTGWTTVVSDYALPSTGVADSGAFYLWKRTASSEPASYTVTASVSERSCAVAWAVANDNGINASGTSATGTGNNITANAVTTTVANCLRISIIASTADRTPVGTLTDHTLMVTQAYASAATLSIQWKAVPDVGIDPAATTTQTTNGWTSHVIAIAPTSVEQTIVPDFIASTSTVYSPTLASGAHAIIPDFIASTSTVYALQRIGPEVEPTAERTYVIAAEDRTYVILAEDRTYVVAAEDRTYVVIGDL
jgi:hypothetical protein